MCGKRFMESSLGRVQSRFDGRGQSLEIKRFVKNLVGPGVHCLAGHFGRAISRHQDDRAPWLDTLHLAEQLQQMQKIGGMSGLMGMLPGIGKVKKQLDAASLDDSVIKRQQAIISSMTRKERRAPKLLNASRKKRIAAGSGTTVQDINKLLKMHRQMADMMKKLGKTKGGLGALFGGGMPDMPPEAMAEGGQLPGLSGLPPGALPGGLPGLGGAGLPPGLPGVPGKKKR